MVKKRTKLEVIRDILDILKKHKHVKITHLIYKANLSNNSIKPYLEELLKNNLIEENRVLKEKLAISEALNKKPNTVIGTQNININLSPWNDPRLPDYVEKYYREAVKKIFLAVPTLIKYIHFNDEHPENHNICIKNARSGIAKVYNGKEWESMDE